MKKQEEYRAEFMGRLKGLMLERGINQQELADAIGLKRQTIALYESGGASPKLEGFVAVAKHFGVSCDYLLGLTDVRTRDVDVKAVVEKYGLNEKSLKTLADAVTVATKSGAPDEGAGRITRALNALLDDMFIAKAVFIPICNILFKTREQPSLREPIPQTNIPAGEYMSAYSAMELRYKELSAPCGDTESQPAKKTPTKKKGAKK